MRIPAEQTDYRLCRLAEHVERNAPAGSRVRDAFATLGAQRNRPGGPSWGAKQMALDAWMALSASEQAEILNGWRAANTLPPSSELVRAAGREVVSVLSAQVNEGDGRVILSPDFSLRSDIAPVSCEILEGTDHPTAVAALRKILAAVESRFAAAIQLEARDYLEVAATDLAVDVAGVESALDRVQAELTRVRSIVGSSTVADAGTFKPGTLVNDLWGDDAGIVVANFTGSSGTLVVYYNAAGEVNSQYEEGLQTGPKKEPQTASRSVSKLGSRKRKAKAVAAE